MTPNLAALEARCVADAPYLFGKQDVAALLTLVRQQQKVVEAAKEVEPCLHFLAGMVVDHKRIHDETLAMAGRLKDALTHLAQG